MTETAPANPRPLPARLPPKPPLAREWAKLPVTYAIIAVCVVNFLVLNFATPAVVGPIAAALAPSAPQIWRGAAWGLVTCAFVHVQIWHIAFNMWWARDFGRLLEPDMGRARLVGFVLSTAAVSSAWQLLTTEETGIGFSGVVYAMFGYVLARRGSHRAYAAFLTPSTIRWLLGWLVICIVLTVARAQGWTLVKEWRVANAAHVAGLASGWLLGTALERPRRRPLALAGTAVLVAGVVSSVAYMPWSASWRSRDAAYAIYALRRVAEAGDPQAEAQYGRLLMRWPERRADAMKWLRRSAEAGDASGMNAFAWWLATAKQDELRDGEEAVRWAERARGAAPGANAEDTLAAAYAERERWSDAVEAEDRAIQGATGAEKPIFERHRANYARREKVRE